jgi:hypothetical protein
MYNTFEITSASYSILYGIQCISYFYGYIIQCIQLMRYNLHAANNINVLLQIILNIIHYIHYTLCI